MCAVIVVYTCRQLANQRDVGWQEYWEILGCYCDLHKIDGLEKLEHYLASLSTPLKPHQSVLSVNIHAHYQGV